MSQAKKTQAQWIATAKMRGQLLFFYQQKVLDLTHFISKHPGGSKVLIKYLYQDITEIVFSVFPHNPQRTNSVLLKHVIGYTAPNQKDPLETKQANISRMEEIKQDNKSKAIDQKNQIQNRQPLQKQLPKQNKQNSMTIQNWIRWINSQENPKKSAKPKRKKYSVSIKLIEDVVGEDGKSPPKQIKWRPANQQMQNSLNEALINNQLEEQMPALKMRAFVVHHMKEL